MLLTPRLPRINKKAILLPGRMAFLIAGEMENYFFSASPKMMKMMADNAMTKG